MSPTWLGIVYAVGGVIALVTALVVWQRRDAPGAIWFALLMGALAWWQVTRALELFGFGLVPFSWTQLQYLGIATVPLLWFLFAVDYCGAPRGLSPSLLRILWIAPLAILAAVFTNRWDGIVFWLGAAVNYLLLVGGTLLFLQLVWRGRAAHRWQAAVILIGVLIPWLANLFYLSGAGLVPGVDVTPLALTLTGVIWVFALYGFRLRELVPVARDVLVASMRDGVIVLDAQDRVVDVNAAALNLLGRTGERWVGLPAARVFDMLPQWSDQLSNAQQAETEIALDGGVPRVLQVRLSPLLDRRARVRGRLVLLQDITARKRAEEELYRANRQLQQQLSEIQALQETLREQAIRDPLTGAYNRRFMLERLVQELARGAREQRAVTVMMMDLDHFKSFNDTYGHTAGDVLLAAWSEWLQAQTRRGDLVCRYGGEEFVLILPGASLEAGMLRAQEWCAGFRSQQILYQGMPLQTTLSIGVAAYPQHGSTPEALLRAADLALYAAKNAGRNCVRSAAEIPFELQTHARLMQTR